MIKIFSKRKPILFGTLFFLLIGNTAGVFAEQDVDNKFDLTKITCGEIVAMPSEDAGYALVLLYGYSQGMSNKAQQTASMISKKIKGAFETCGSTPDLPALKSFSEAGDL